MKDNLNESELLDRLITNYKKKLLYYKQILDLTKEQQKVIENEAWEELSQLTADKEEVINKINKLETKIESSEEKLAQKSNLQSTSKAKKLKNIVDKAYETMQQISELEQLNQNKIAFKKQEMQQEINEVNSGLSVNEAYNGQSNSYEGKFIDKKE